MFPNTIKIMNENLNKYFLIFFIVVLIAIAIPDNYVKYAVLILSIYALIDLVPVFKDCDSVNSKSHDKTNNKSKSVLMDDSEEADFSDELSPTLSDEEILSKVMEATMNPIDTSNPNRENTDENFDVNHQPRFEKNLDSTYYTSCYTRNVAGPNYTELRCKDPYSSLVYNDNGDNCPNYAGFPEVTPNDRGDGSICTRPPHAPGRQPFDLQNLYHTGSRGLRDKQMFDGIATKTADHYKRFFHDELDQEEEKPWWGRDGHLYDLSHLY